METFSALLAICKDQWRGALMFTLICARINGWVNNCEAGDLRRNRAHYDVIIMYWNGTQILDCFKDFFLNTYFGIYGSVSEDYRGWTVRTTPWFVRICNYAVSYYMTHVVNFVVNCFIVIASLILIFLIQVIYFPISSVLPHWNWSSSVTRPF